MTAVLSRRNIGPETDGAYDDDGYPVELAHGLDGVTGFRGLDRVGRPSARLWPFDVDPSEVLG